MKRIITYGTFDLLHYGHINLLRRAKALGDYLVVGLSTDEFNWNSKHKKCYFSYEKRKQLLEAIRYVDLVIPEESWEQKKNDVELYKIDTFVMGDDWKGKFDFLNSQCEVVYLPRTPEISTTQIKNDLKEKFNGGGYNCRVKFAVKFSLPSIGGCLMSKDEEIIGYTSGVFDLFHIGHLNLLKNAKGMCDKLVVGVTVDDLVQYKGKNAMIPFEDRIEIVRSCKYVDAVVPQYDMDKLTMCKKLKASILFVGDDWYGTEKWKKYEEEFSKENIRIVYFPYTKGISSTKITEALKNTRGWVQGEEK